MKEIISSIILSIITMIINRYKFLNEFLKDNSICGDITDNNQNDPEYRKRLAYRKRHKIPNWCIDTTDLHIIHHGKHDNSITKKRIKIFLYAIWTFYV